MSLGESQPLCFNDGVSDNDQCFLEAVCKLTRISSTLPVGGLHILLLRSDGTRTFVAHRILRFIRASGVASCNPTVGGIANESGHVAAAGSSGSCWEALCTLSSVAIMQASFSVVTALGTKWSYSCIVTITVVIFLYRNCFGIVTALE